MFNSSHLHCQLLSALQNIIGNGGINLTFSSGCPDAVSWAIMALRASGATDNLKQVANLLAAWQLSDGRVIIAPDHPEAFWPTPLAVLAWNQIPGFFNVQSRACRFLLQTTGAHYPREKDAAYAHDPAIPGWPWISETHSWVIPTSMSILALKAVGFRSHKRVQEGLQLLLDRQLPHGGWNYGNTLVYGQELLPFPESTGVALSALAGSIPEQDIGKSLSYLRNSISQIKTPLSMSWGLLGLNSWEEKVSASESLLADCWRRQERYGGYNVKEIALLVLALILPRGLLSLYN